MSFKIAIFAAAVFACQVNAQLGIVRPFAAGFSSGIAEMAKPFVDLGESVVDNYLPGNRKPQNPQWINYPAQMVPQVQPAYPGYEGFTSGMPGSPYGQVYRPRPSVVYNPEPQYYPHHNQVNALRPVSYPMPASVPAVASLPAPASAFVPSASDSSSSSEESKETRVPSSLLVQPESAEVKVPKPTDFIPKGTFKIPSL